MSEEITQIISQTTQMNHKNYMRHFELLNKIPPQANWTPIDEAIYSTNDLFGVKVEKAEKLRFNAIKYSFIQNYTHNHFYYNLCQQRCVKPENIETLNDLHRIPLIPQRIFKQYPEPELFIPWLRGLSSDTIKYPSIKGSSYMEIIEKLNTYGIKILFSSGTTGKSSMLPRDSLALMREAYYRISYWQLEGISNDTYYIGLGLDPRKLHPNWSIAHGLGGDIAARHSENQVYHTLEIKANPDTIKTLMGIEKGKKQLEQQIKETSNVKIIQLLKDMKEKRCKGLLHGAPYLINEFLDEIETSSIDLYLGDKWAVETGGGGWLKVSQEDLYRKIENVLGIPNCNCRDIYGMAENTFAFPSCEGHYYHIPHTVIQAFILDENLEPLDFGETGRWAFIDPAPTAYPGYIITEDKVKLLEKCPVCDRPGPVISHPVLRMPGNEEAGCSAMMKKLMEQEISKT